MYQQTQRWLRAGVFEAIVHDLRRLLRELADRPPQPNTAVLDGRTLQSTPISGVRAGYDGHKRRKGSKVHMAGWGTPANEQERAQVEQLATPIQAATGDAVEVALVDQGYTGDQPASVGWCAPTSG